MTIFMVEWTFPSFFVDDVEPKRKDDQLVSGSTRLVLVIINRKTNHKLIMLTK